MRLASREDLTREVAMVIGQRNQRVYLHRSLNYNEKRKNDDCRVGDLL